MAPGQTSQSEGQGEITAAPPARAEKSPGRNAGGHVGTHVTSPWGGSGWTAEPTYLFPVLLEDCDPLLFLQL